MNCQELPNIPASALVAEQNLGNYTLLNILPNTSEYLKVQDQMKASIKDNCEADSIRYSITGIEKLQNIKIWNRYIKYRQLISDDYGQANERMLFHGTRFLNQILEHGFDVRKANINGTFGPGIYFSEYSKVSNKYVYGFNGGCPFHGEKLCLSCERQMFLCRVALGKVFIQNGAKQMAHAPPEHHSVFGSATGLEYPEYVVYRGEQIFPEYILTYRIVKTDDVFPEDM